jgi:hypothetical protein
MAIGTNKEQKLSEKAMTPEEIRTMMVQLQKDATLPSLLCVTRKLGEVEGMISMQEDPSEELVNIQKDFKQVYDKLSVEAGIEPLSESEGKGIGGDE